MLILIHYQLFEFETVHYQLSCKIRVHAKVQAFLYEGNHKHSEFLPISWLNATKVAISLAQNIVNPFLFLAGQLCYLDVHKQSFLAIAIAHLQCAQNPATAAAKIEFKNRLKVDFEVDYLDLRDPSIYTLHCWARNGATTNYRITRIISIPPKTAQKFPLHCPMFYVNLTCHAVDTR